MKVRIFTLFLTWYITILFFQMHPCSGKKNETVKMGRRYKDDRLLHEYHVTLNGSERKYARVQTASTYYPGSNTSRVTCIYLIDFMQDNRQGYAFIYSGGVRERHAAIVFRSQSRAGLNMACEIYGFDPEPVLGEYESEVSEESTENYVISSRSVESD